MTSDTSDPTIRSHASELKTRRHRTSTKPGADIFSATALHTTVHFGTWQIYSTDSALTDGQHIVLVKGSVEYGRAVPCRVASSCITSLALDSAECDCREQMIEAMSTIHKVGKGVLIYLDQEGRGHGLTTKIRALANKNIGMDTFAAVEALGVPADIRVYDDVPKILNDLRVASISLLANNPDKASALRDVGIDVIEVRPISVVPNVHARLHQEAKRLRGHTV
jgi:GTP cyclohydrolase II